jgi:hypothetical protein
MRAHAFWKAIAVDRSGLLERLTGFLAEHAIRYCVVGGQAVNAYVDPLVSLDLDLAVAAGQAATLEPLLRSAFRVERFPHSVNVSLPGSDLRVQFQTDPRYASFVERASAREVLGVMLPVAHVEDVLRGKVWAAQDASRRPSKRQKDLADIARLIEARPELRGDVPADVLSKLV